MLTVRLCDSVLIRSQDNLRLFVVNVQSTKDKNKTRKGSVT